MPHTVGNCSPSKKNRSLTMHVYLSLKLTIKGIVQQFSPLQKYDQDFFSRVIDNLQLVNP